MHKKPLSSRFPHTLQLASELGKPLTFIAVEPCGTAGNDGAGIVGLSEFAVVVIGNHELPYAIDGFLNPECEIPPDQLLRSGRSAKAIAALPTWQRVWQEGLGHAVAESLVVGTDSIQQLLQLLDVEARRYELPAVSWDWISLMELFSSATGRTWRGNLQMMAEELVVDVPGLTRRVTAEPVLMARLFEAILAGYGSESVALSRRLQTIPLPPPVPVNDPFSLAPTRARPDLRLVESAQEPAGDPFALDGFDGDNVPAMTPFYGGAFSLQELIDVLLDQMVVEGLVKNFAGVIGVLRGLGLVVEKSGDPYRGVVVETAIRAKRRLRGKYYRPNFEAAPMGDPAPAAGPARGHPDLLTQLEQQIRTNGYRSLEHQVRLIEAEYPQSTRQNIAYAISMLLDQDRLEHELASDESVLCWLTDAVGAQLRPQEPVLLKRIMTDLLRSPALSPLQLQRLDYVQLRVALHRLGVPYPAKKRVG